MADPAQSLFCGVDLQLDTVDQQQREEEEEEREEAARLEANLAEKMQGAFDDLEIESDDDDSDESILCQLPVTHGDDLFNVLCLIFMIDWFSQVLQ